jgi:hypothetical protein
VPPWHGRTWGAPRLNALLKARDLTNKQVARLLVSTRASSASSGTAGAFRDADQLALMVSAAGGSGRRRAGPGAGRAQGSRLPAVPSLDTWCCGLLRDAERLTAAATEVREATRPWKRK